MKKDAISGAADTHPGCARENNEDRYHIDPERGIFVVIDGVGGHAAGDVAADIALDIVCSRLKRLTGTAAERLNEAITLANNEIFNRARTRDDWSGMACVLTAAVVEDGRTTVGHVGDTRFYKISNGQLRKVTHDHSPVGEREDAGELSEFEAMLHPRRNEVYRDVGTQMHEPGDHDFVELLEVPFELDSALLMCSDGLSDMIPSAQISRIIEEYAPVPAEVVRHLIDAANEAGGRDNVTVVFAAGSQFASRVRANGRVSSRKDEAPTRALSGADHEAEGVFTEPPPDARAGRWQRAREWLAARAQSFTVVPVASLLGGVLLCLFTLVLLPEGWKKGWPVADEALPKSPPGPRRLFVGGAGGTARSINEALAQARPGDIVEVARGAYEEHVTLREGVSLVSMEPFGAVIFPPAGTERRVAVIARGIAGARLVGFKIAGDEAHPLDVGMSIEDSSVEVERTEITGAAVAGVELGGGRGATLSANRIHDNPGSGLVIRGQTTPRVFNNIIEGNGRGSGSAGAERRPEVEVLDGATPLLVGNVFTTAGEGQVVGLSDEQLNELREQNFFVGPADEQHNPARRKTRRRPGRR